MEGTFVSVLQTELKILLIICSLDLRLLPLLNTSQSNLYPPTQNKPKTSQLPTQLHNSPFLSNKKGLTYSSYNIIVNKSKYQYELLLQEIHKAIKPSPDVKINPRRPNIKFRTNFNNCILQAFEQRSYQKVQGDDWDIIWSQKEFIPDLYEKKLAGHQKINHFKNYYELCKKDQLIKNLKKHKKALQRQGKTAQANQYNFYPQTYIVPNQYVLFADEFKKHQASSQNKNIWIMKPTGKSQGKGIFLFNKLSQISQWQNHSAQTYIVQKYINDPLLIGGKKFDIRLYALVVSYSPLTVYFYRGGFARFTHCRYDQTKIQNSQIHLTNVAIQKHAEGYDQVIGGKWYIDYLKHYLVSKYGEAEINQSFIKIQEVIIRTLQALQKVMASDKNNSFQLYGFDILLNSKLDPWLIQVNGSPSMTANTSKDHDFKMGLMDDTLTVIDMQKFLLGNEQQIGGFDLIYKEKVNKAKQKTVIPANKVSFLGCFNNRLDNLKKLAKNYATRLNEQYDAKRQIEKKRVMSSANGNHTHDTSKSSTYGSKRNITNRKYVPAMGINQTKILSNGTNNTNISKNQSANMPPKQVNRDFVIKNKIRREYTNQNESRVVD